MEQPVFRPVKRRKFLRRRQADDEVDTIGRDDAVSDEGTGSDSQARMFPAHSERANMNHPADPPRLRKLFKARKGGIEFSATKRPAADAGDKSTGQHPGAEDPEAARIQAMYNRFTAHTGQKVDVDKHMMEYIESELTKRQQSHSVADLSYADARRGPDAGMGVSSTAGVSQRGAAPSAFVQREPASLGKLHEIDLGQEAKLQNIARTEAATRKLAGAEHPASEEDETAPTTRLGKDGKPWRHRKRRTSEDRERDKLVEEVLRESKLDVYDELEMEEQEDGQAADDRIAEQFRREFLDAIQFRRRIARARATKPNKSAAPRGPKLGGSRSARAAMREMQEKSSQR